MELKPDNVPIKEWLVKGIADSLNIPERVVATIVDFQFSEARESLLTCNSIEFSGFGKFIFNKRKAEKKLAKIVKSKEYLEEIINSPDTKEQKRVSSHFKLQIYMADIKLLRNKL
jgi:nucleoid DNA-binding protein